MPMQAASLEVLEKANVPTTQARAIVQAIEIEMTGAQNILATRRDLVPIHEEIVATKQSVVLLQQDVGLLKQDVGTLKQDVVALAKEVVAADHRLELKIERLELKIEALRGEMHANIRNILWQIYMTMLAQIGATLSAVYFLMTHFKP